MRNAIIVVSNGRHSTMSEATPLVGIDTVAPFTGERFVASIVEIKGNDTKHGSQ